MKKRTIILKDQMQPNRKKTDFWGALFVFIICLSSMGSFLLANHGSKKASDYLDPIPPISTTMIDTDQNGKSEKAYTLET
ncbi:hypothetical protein [Marinomonas sp. IMCC 4694]|uniref:hypothetical protein n=1 Tax=Marinomonas sp. IMCC 4694 TaxID=2605432 RepID=UPI0011E6C278|nr:hypothetical protein [Marinomonas sp. IMCC 4694]TYL47375.1 hypothetical protein FXV75_05080 [Marinomonas sp. IMCC 4694]